MPRFSFLLALVLVAACAEKSNAPKEPSDVQRLSEIRSTKAPTPGHALDIRFDTKVRLLGYDLDSDPVVTGRPFRVTWYFQVDAPLDPGFQIFTHLGDGKTNRLNLDATRILRRVHPVDRWKSGEFIKDVQEVTIPERWKSDVAVFYLGFYKGDTRLSVSRGPHGGDNRAEALRVRVVAQEEQKPVPRLFAHRLSSPIVLDGKLDEPDWSAAQSTGPFANTMTGGAGGFRASARVLYDATHLYVGFEVEDDYLKSSFTKQDDHLWEQDAVELMIDPDGDAKNYFELQVSPRGVSFDTRYDSPRSPRPFGHVDWSSQVRAGVTLDGKLDDEDKDRGYVVELALPWSALATGAVEVVPPSAGATFRMNFFVMDSRPRGQRAVGWSAPLVGDFHTLSRFGRVVFPQAAAGPASTTEESATKAAAAER